MITIEEFKKKQLNTSRLIGLDLGSKRFGVAICDENQKIATPILFEPKSNPNNLDLLVILFLNSSIVIILYLSNLSDSFHYNLIIT